MLPRRCCRSGSRRSPSPRQLGALQAARRSSGRPANSRRLRLAAVLAFRVHQHEAGRVPQLVAEVAVAFAAAQVEVDVASQRGVAGHREAQASVPNAGMPSGNSLRVAFSIDAACFGFIRPVVRLATSDSTSMPSIRSIGSSVLPFDFDIFWPDGVAHEAVHVHRVERHLAGEVRGHHDHPRDPEEDDVEAGDQHRRRQEQSSFRRFFRPAERRERHQRGREPRVEHVVVALQRARDAGRRGLGALPLRCGRRRFRRSSPYQAGIWWPHQSWREMHQSWMLLSHWL
jgi:hypothetical protein